MKQKNNYRYLLMGLVMAFVSSAVMLSCKDDDPSLAELRDDKISFLADSLRVGDSLRRLNQAGVVNYAITVVSGSTSTLFKSTSRTEGSKSVISDALVTISQFGKIVTDTTDASGMVVLNGFFRGAVNITVAKEDHTTATFVVAVKNQDDTENGTINFVGNIIPIFETTGTNTATVSGLLRVQSDLTNTTSEPVPAGTTLIAHIDAKNSTFADKFLTPGEYLDTSGDDDVILVGNILDAAYSTGVIGTTAADGTYTVTLPAAIDGLPTVIEYSDIALNRLRFDDDSGGPDPNSSNRTITERTIYGPGAGASFIPNPASATTVAFDAGHDAEAFAEISPAGTVENIVISNGGSSWTGTPTITLVGDGVGATATATVTGGVLTGITVTSKGTGYTSAPDVEIHYGFNAQGTVLNLNNDGKVTGVILTNSGSGYTAAPTVTFTGGGTPTTPAAATANISGGRVTSITITNQGDGYSGAPAVSLTGGTTTGTAATVDPTARFSGRSIGAVAITDAGEQYSFAPAVLFDAPETAGGSRATGTVSFDPVSGQVTAIQVTSSGTGYINAPGLTIYSVIDTDGPPTADAFLTGSGVTGLFIDDQGEGYVAAPAVVFQGGGGTGAAATATINNGHVVTITVTNAGSGYTSAPDVFLVAGTGAAGVVQIGADGAITGVKVTANGSGYVGAPKVTFSTFGEGFGDGATATANIASGQVGSVTITAGGSGYRAGNTPSGNGNGFSGTFNLVVKPGLKYIIDAHYGSGNVQPQ